MCLRVFSGFSGCGQKRRVPVHIQINIKIVLCVSKIQWSPLFSATICLNNSRKIAELWIKCKEKVRVQPQARANP